MAELDAAPFPENAITRFLHEESKRKKEMAGIYCPDVDFGKRAVMSDFDDCPTVPLQLEQSDEAAFMMFAASFQDIVGESPWYLKYPVKIKP